MNKAVALLVFALVFGWQDQEEQTANPEMQHQEIVNLENEAARAIQTNAGTFFRRVYSDDFSGSLSHGQTVNKTHFIEAVQAPDVHYDSFNASDINVRIFKDTAIATCMWSARGVYREEKFTSQMRVIHVYINGPRGWHVIAGQITMLPPGAQQPL